MQRQQMSRITWIVLALLAAAGFAAWAQSGDTPIVILDGSLSMESAVPWNQFTGGGDQRGHPHANKAVTSVEVVIGDKTQTIDFKGEQCTVAVSYAGKDITITTAKNGKGLKITPLSLFADGDTPNRKVHKNQSAKISHVKVMKAGAKVFDSDASGGTKVTIHYQ